MAPSAPSSYVFDHFRLSGDGTQLERDGAVVPLAPKVLQTLLVLTQHAGHVVKKADLMEAVWPDRFVEETGLTRNISLLRQALGDEGERLIVTVARIGYRFDAAVEPTEARAAVPNNVEARPQHQLQNNLPQALTPFIGRHNELNEIRELMSRTRLFTLSGPGGIGKTRLGLQVAANSLREYENGVWFVEFASIADARLVPQTVASSLGVREESGRPIVDTLANYLKNRRLLLVLDNCEHLISECAQLSDTLLRVAPNLRVLATSRESLGIAGETVFRVPSLGVPNAQRPPDLESLAKHEAVELFVDRARAAKSTFAITTATAVPLMRVCARLEGIPLAIELAASRVKVLSIEQIADRLDDPLNLLTSGSRTAPPRHQTLLAAIDWSYDLLTEPEKILFRRLSVFAGGWTLEAAERVCSGDGVDERSVLELLSGLVDKSLVLPEDRNGQQRYRFMVTLREYAHKRLMQIDQGDTIHRRYAEFFVALATESESKLIGAEQQPWLTRLNDEYDNIRTVLSWTSKHDVDMRLRFAGALGRFWYLRGYLDEGRRWLAEVLANKASNAQVEHRIKSLTAAARIAVNQGDYVSVGSSLDEALTLARESGNKRETAEALNMLAIITGEQDDFAAARSFLEEALLIRRQLGDKGWVALALNNLGVLAIRQADFSSATSRLDEALSLSREVGDPHGIATAMGNRAEVAKRLGDYAMAESLRAQGLAIAQDFGDKTVMVPAFGGLGNLARQQGDYPRARLLLEEGLKLSRELGNKTAIADHLQSLGLVAEACADNATARSLFEQAIVIRRGLGEKLTMAVALNGLGRVMARLDDTAAARSLHEQALDIGKRSEARDSIAQSINGLADLARRQGDDALALSHYKQSLALWWELGEAPELPHSLESMGALVAAHAQHELAASLWGAAAALRTAIGVPRPPSEADEYQRNVTAARAALGEDAFEVAWAQGQAMTPNQAVAHALEEAGR